MPRPAELKAELYGEGRARPRPARLRLHAGWFELKAGRTAWQARRGLVARAHGSQAWRFDLGYGASAVLRGSAAALALDAAGLVERPLFSRPRPRRLLLAACAAGALLVGAVFGLGWGQDALLEAALRRLPADTEERLFKDAVPSAWLQDLNSDPATALVLRSTEQALRQKGEAQGYRVLIVEDPLVNAFAFPGGRILVFRGLLDKLRDPSEFFALLGHEAGHLRRRHALKRLSRSAALGGLATLFFGDASGLSAVLLDNARGLLELSYSRDEELESDREGLQELERLGMDLRGAERLMVRLKLASGAGLGIPALLSSHPATDERLELLRKRIAELEAKGGRKRAVAVLSAGDWSQLKRAPASPKPRPARRRREV